MTSLKGIFILVHLINIALAEIKISKDWIEPDAWGRAKAIKLGDDIITETAGINANQCVCPNIEEQSKTDQMLNIDLSLMFYKKLFYLLFEETNYQVDEQGDSLSRSLQLTMYREEFNLVKNSEDLRDWDAFVTNIFKNVKTISCFDNEVSKSGYFSINPFSWFLVSSGNWFSHSEFRFLLYIAICLLCGIYFHKRHKYGLIAIFIVGIFSFGYLYTYWQCNKEIEIKELANLMSFDSEDPCENIGEHKSWSIWNLFSKKSTKAQCLEHLKEKHKMKLPFCRPDDVFFMYLNEIILNQFETIVQKCTNIFKGCMEKMPFPYNIIAMIIFALMLPVFFKLVFKSGTQLISASMKNDTSNNINANNSSTATQSQNNEDRIEQLFRLHLESNKQNGESINTLAKFILSSSSSSGVQNLDAIENSSEKLEILHSEEVHLEINKEVGAGDTKSNNLEKAKSE